MTPITLPKVYNRATYTPYYYSKNDGYGALGAVKVDRNSGSEMDLTWKTDFTTVAWEHGAGPFELYLIPAPTLLEGELGPFVDGVRSVC